MSLYSSKDAIGDNKYYQELTPQLQERLVMKVLRKHFLDFQYFFNDYISGVKAPQAFIVQLLANLEMGIFKDGDVVVERGQTMNKMYLV